MDLTTCLWNMLATCLDNELRTFHKLTVVTYTSRYLYRLKWVIY